MKTATFQAEILHLSKLMQWLHTNLKGLPLDEPALGKIELASEEVFVNIVHHSYRGRGGEVEVSIKVYQDGIEIMFKDTGPPFDPLTYLPNFDPLAALEERKVGGLGLFFMRQYMDAVHYTHDGARNCLTLVKKFKKPAA